MDFITDFKMDPVGDEDLKRIEKKMHEHIRANHTLTREEHDNETLRDMFAKNPFKIEIMNDKIGMDVGSSAYRQGNFVGSLSRPHVPSTSYLRWFKHRHQWAYWKGDRSNESLVRIYGMCFYSKDELRERERQIEEAKKRDHKK